MVPEARQGVGLRLGRVFRKSGEEQGPPAPEAAGQGEPTPKLLIPKSQQVFGLQHTVQYQTNNSHVF